ncbi:guanylate kinase [Stylonychia lemnae]|uniref:Guanylate kinase n=1 Tax=Stylonychia lemnae TaxID=5949 RepID=A0A078AAF5_STYLE|nr:guanylate kinase [Stylonychia lemnae]|eukprot:CDW78851.1 guanylate kinase [Stylonychia lemnae]
MAQQLLRPLVISGPSGAGKSTLIHHLLNKYSNKFKLSVSSTTRQPRSGEVDGEIENGQFLEHNKVHNNYYGTHKAQILKTQSENKICLLDIDVKGARDVSKSDILCHYIFIQTKNIEDLRQRLLARKTETEESIKIRLQNAEKEISFAQELKIFEKWFCLERVRDSLQYHTLPAHQANAVCPQITHQQIKQYFILQAHCEFENIPNIVRLLFNIKKEIKKLAYMDQKKYLTPLFSGACSDIYIALRDYFNQKSSKMEINMDSNNEFNASGSIKNMNSQNFSQNMPKFGHELSFSQLDKNKFQPSKGQRSAASNNYSTQQNYQNPNAKMQATINANKLIININNDKSSLSNPSYQKDLEKQDINQNSSLQSHSAMVTPRDQKFRQNQRYTDMQQSNTKKPKLVQDVTPFIGRRQESQKIGSSRKRDSSEVLDSINLDQHNMQKQLEDMTSPFKQGNSDLMDHDSLLRSLRNDDDINQFRETFMRLGQNHPQNNTQNYTPTLDQHIFAASKKRNIKPQHQVKVSQESLAQFRTSGQKFAKIKKYKKVLYKRLSQGNSPQRQVNDSDFDIMPEIHNQSQLRSSMPAEMPRDDKLYGSLAQLKVKVIEKIVNDDIKQLPWIIDIQGNFKYFQD